MFFFFFLQNVYFKSKFYFNKDKKDVLAYSFSVLYSLPGETVTWVSCRRLVGREQEPLIHPGSSIFGQGWKPQTQWVFHTRGHPKRHINQISKGTKAILFIYCLFNIITIPNRASLLCFLCPTLLLHLHRSAHQKFPPVFYIVSLLRTYLTLNKEGSSHAH